MSVDATVAIVGIGGCFPGAIDPKIFQRMILDKQVAARQVPEGRWPVNPRDVYDKQLGKPDRVYSLTGCFVDDDAFVLPFDRLQVSPELMDSLDPMFKVLLYAGERAFADAQTDQLDRSRTGVIIGNIVLPTEKSSLLAQHFLGRRIDELVQGKIGKTHVLHFGGAASINRYAAGLPAGVLARALGLGGGGYTLDAACASSLYAMKLAVDELVSGRTDAMLTGGLSRPDSLYTQMGFSQLRALSPSGTCSPFDAAANGLVVGEGCGMFLLKRLDDALAQGDRIYGVIRGAGLSNDIGGSLLAPISEGQVRAMEAAYRQAGWSPSDVDLIACHATGTPVGDAVEFQSLGGLWRNESDARPGQCVISSVKANVGHLLTAAGASSLMQVLLALKHETLPPTANFSRANDHIALKDSPFSVLTEAREWSRRASKTTRKAAVSAFGFGGINAHLLVEEFIPAAGRNQVAVGAPEPKQTDIAVIGLGAYFGHWRTLQSFQHRVLGGGEPVSPREPISWWDVETADWFKQSMPETPVGHFVDSLELPIGKFKIPPYELCEMLPQQLLMLLVAAAAIEDAGTSKDSLSQAGIFTGLGLDLNTTNYSLRWLLEKKHHDWARQLGLSQSQAQAWLEEMKWAASPALNANRVMGGLGGVVSSRIAREYRIGGPCFTLAGEDGSGLRALEAAIRSLQRGELDVAVAGAVDLAGDVRAALSAHESRPYSAAFKPFDPRSKGTWIGEGAGAVVLKRLDRALADGDRIYAVIKGMGSASGSTGSWLPTADAYCSALTRAYEDAGVDRSSVDYVETNGSGIPTEDALEVSALKNFFGSGDHGREIFLGSAKGDVGHAGAASGMASFIKSCLVLYQEVIPPLRERCEVPEGLEGFRLPRKPHFWLRNREDGPRRAGVSNFSPDGNCVHLVLEQAPAESVREAERRKPLGDLPEGIFVLEAEEVVLFRSSLIRLSAHAESYPQFSIDLLANAWFERFPLMGVSQYALVFIASDVNELLDLIDLAFEAFDDDSLERFQPGTGRKGGERIFFSDTPLGKRGDLAMVFPGSGNHFPNMGRELACYWPEILRGQDQVNLRLKDHYEPHHIWNEQGRVPDDIRATIFSQVAMGTLLYDLLSRFAIQPQAVIGYSLGESMGLFATRTWRERDEMNRRMRTSGLFYGDLSKPFRAARKAWGLSEDEAVDWTIGVVNRPADKVRVVLENHERVYLLIVNTPKECVIGGARERVQAAVAALGCHFFPLEGVPTVHCEITGEVEQAYYELHLFETHPPEAVLFYSGCWGRSYEMSTENAARSILDNALHGVDFPKTVEVAYEDGVRLFVEVGPGASCTRMVRKILGKKREHVARSACVPGQEPVLTLFRLLAELIVNRVPVDLSAIYDGDWESARLEFQKREGVVVNLGGLVFDLPDPPEPDRGGGRDNDKGKTEKPVADKSVTPKPITAFPRSGEKNAAPSPDVSEMARGTGVEQVKGAGVVFGSRSEKQVGPVKGATGGMKQDSGRLTEVVRQMGEATAARATSHDAYLRFVANMGETMAENLRFQWSLLESINGAAHVSDEIVAGSPESLDGTRLEVAAHADGPRMKRPLPGASPKPVFDRDMCLEFAVGSLEKMLGSEFAEVDSFPTRVRLPDEPLMLVDRIVSVEGERMKRGRVVTEHDVLPEAWYLDGGRIATCVAIEAGQADLFLSAYLGIDFITKGLSVYRLLDAEVTFHRELPGPGEVIQYDIHIESFFKHGQTHLFRFNFEGSVNGEPLLSMRQGCAGFFSQAELAAGKGIVLTQEDLEPLPGKLPANWVYPLPMVAERYDARQVEALRRGDLAGCFGPLFADLPLAEPMRLPTGRMNLVDRVVSLEPSGGRYGLGVIKAEADIHPGDWFLVCHFVDDQVMPGTLMYECCLHTLRIFLMRMGWVGEHASVSCHPVMGVASKLICRGQVLETTKKVTYEVIIKELGYRPEPYAIADAYMYSDEKRIVDIRDMCVRMAGLDEGLIQALWRGRAGVETQPAPVNGPRPAIFDRERILAFANGKPSDAFGDRYKPFDAGRRIARFPSPPFLFMHRVVAIDAEPWVMEKGGTVEVQYDVAPDDWYFASNRQKGMPLTVLLEIALQSCGWMAAYKGSALVSANPLSFRNLGGRATQFLPVYPETGTLTTHVTSTDISKFGDMIIQNFDFAVYSVEGLVYKGDTYFGFFTDGALADQKGVGDAAPFRPDRSMAGIHFPRNAPFPDDTMRMVDEIDCFLPDHGAFGLGFVSGVKHVNPDDWFFKAHFLQDPVWPGTLGLEAMLQLLKYAARQRWDVGDAVELRAVALEKPHTWVYRGQVIPTNKTVNIQASIKSIDDQAKIIVADGFLEVDGLTIYHMIDFSIQLVSD